MKVFINSLPKSGTNLLEKLMSLQNIEQSGKSIASSNIIGRYSFLKSMLHQDHFAGISIPVGLEFPVSVSIKWLQKTLNIRDGQYLSGHAAYSSQLDSIVTKKGLRVIQIYRDPRAVLVSWAKFVAEEENSWYPFHTVFKNMNMQDRLSFLLYGGEINGLFYSPFKEVLSRSGGWLESNNALIVKFEDLVGSKGGGTDEAQRIVIEKVLRHIGKEYVSEDLDKLQSALYGGTHTFRNGQVEGWRGYIDAKFSSEIMRELGECEVVKKLGYTNSN